MPLRVSCPYCNSRFAIPEVPASGRAACPRCGDAFNTQGRIEEDRDGVSAAVALPGAADAHGFPSHGFPSSNRRVLLPLALVVALVAGAVMFLYYGGLLKRPQPGPDGPEGAGQRPLELGGLGFVPPNSNIVFAIQMGPLLGYCERTDQDPRVLLSQAGVPPSVLAKLDRAGVPLEKINHITAGAHVPDAADLGQLRLVIAVVLSAPLDDEARFLEELEARSVKQGGKPHYRVELGPLPLQLVRVSTTEWVIGWSDEDVRACGDRTSANSIAGAARRDDRPPRSAR